MRIFVNISTLEKRLEYQFKDKTLLQRALTHKSAHHCNNERLEFLGDAILNCVVAALLYQRFEDAPEGDLTRCRAKLVKKETLSAVACEWDLGDFLTLGMGEQKSGGFRRQSILADALEAIVGAIYLDSGFDEAFSVISKWFSKRIEALNPDQEEKDPKTRLQEWLQANQKPLPLYQIDSMTGDPHDQIFVVSCKVDGITDIAQGSGASKRIAEQQAARIMLGWINKVKEVF